jgi:hypothetical protein
MEEGRRRRLALLQKRLAKLSRDERVLLDRAAEIMLKLSSDR